MRIIGVIVALACCGSTAFGQFDQKEQPHGIRLDKPLTQRWKVGVKINAVAGPCGALTGTVPVPTDWPEQQVRIDAEEISPLARRVTYREIDGIKQMVFSVPQIPAGQIVSVMVTYEVTRSSVLPPEKPELFNVPKTVPREFRQYLGPSPGIDPRQTQIRNKAKELVEGKEGGWKQVEALYDWVRDNVKDQGGRFKGALPAMKDGAGCRDDLTSLFIALCRAHGVPARTVWVMDNAYAEFYLEDTAGKGAWFPCQVAGAREFGAMSDHRPIMQKGENIKVPEHNEPQRFVAEFITGKGSRTGGKPQVDFVRNLLPGN